MLKTMPMPLLRRKKQKWFPPRIYPAAGQSSGVRNGSSSDDAALVTSGITWLQSHSPGAGKGVAFVGFPRERQKELIPKKGAKNSRPLAKVRRRHLLARPTVARTGLGVGWPVSEGPVAWIT